MRYSAALPTLRYRLMTFKHRKPRTSLFFARGDGPESSIFMPTPPKDWTAFRKAHPLDQLLPATRRWAAALPDTAVPTHLIKTYPRLANRIALAWGDPRSAKETLDDLLIDRRGKRQGFPPFVLAELMALRSYLDGAHSMHLRQR